MTTQARPLNYPWHWEDTLIAGAQRPLAVASDPDGMLLEACRRQDEGETDVIDPFWATTWRAASGLDRYLDHIPLDQVNVLELGCGTGHAGIAAAFRGAHVTLTDGVEDPLHLARLSLSRLGLKADVQVLRFGVDKIEDKQFPVILGSDVTYLRELWPELMVTAADHLTPDGQLILSDPKRLIANEFRDWIDTQDWDYEEHEIVLEDDPEHPIRIMCLRSKAAQ